MRKLRPKNKHRFFNIIKYKDINYLQILPMVENVVMIGIDFILSA